jgi:phytol kinase
MTALLIALSLLLMIGLLATTTVITRRLGLHPETARKTIHVGLGLYCLCFPLLFDQPGPVIVLCASAVILMLALRASRYRHSGLGAGLHGVARESYGELLFAVSVALVFTLGHRQAVTYLLPIAILTLSDAAAALVGVRYGRVKFRIDGGYKSLEGAVIFMLTAWIISMCLLLMFSHASRLSVIVLGCLIAVYGTLVEGASWRGWDNFFLPIAIHTVLLHALGVPSGVLLATAAISLLCWGAVLLVGPRLGLDRHAATFLTAVVATIAMVSSPWNIVLPIVALLGHVASRDASPEGFTPHLRLGLVMMMLALAWYLVGELTSLPILYAFNTSFGALALALLAARGRTYAALLMLPLCWILIEARSLVGPGWTPTDRTSQMRLLGVLAVALAAGAVGHRLRRPPPCEGVGVISFAAGVTVLATVL